MTYSNKFVMCLLYNGNVQKEKANGVVTLPFGAEYALRFRNKNNRRAMVKITIDGEEVSGGGYIIPANSCIDIERWADKAVKFKFVSLDSEEAIDFGKNGPNEDKVKGTIEAKFYLEKEAPKSVEHHHHWHSPTIVQPIPPYWYENTYTSSGVNYSGDAINLTNVAPGDSLRASSSLKRRRRVVGGATGQSCDSREMLCGQSMDESIPMSFNASTPVQDGCTVEGNYSNQTFRTVWFDHEDDYVALKIFLQGFEKEVKEPKPVRSLETVKSRKLRELEEENRRLKEELERQQVEDAETDEIRKLEEENQKLRESLGK